MEDLTPHILAEREARSEAEADGDQLLVEAPSIPLVAPPIDAPVGGPNSSTPGSPLAPLEPHLQRLPWSLRRAGMIAEAVTKASTVGVGTFDAGERLKQLRGSAPTPRLMDAPVVWQRGARAGLTITPKVLTDPRLLKTPKKYRGYSKLHYHLGTHYPDMARRRGTHYGNDLGLHKHELDQLDGLKSLYPDIEQLPRSALLRRAIRYFLASFAGENPSGGLDKQKYLSAFPWSGSPSRILLHPDSAPLTSKEAIHAHQDATSAETGTTPRRKQFTPSNPI